MALKDDSSDSDDDLIFADADRCVRYVSSKLVDCTCMMYVRCFTESGYDTVLNV